MSDLVLHCVPMSNKKDARLIRVNVYKRLSITSEELKHSLYYCAKMPVKPASQSHIVDHNRSASERPFKDGYWMKVFFGCYSHMKCTNVKPVHFERFCILYIGNAKRALVQLHVCLSVIS